MGKFSIHIIALFIILTGCATQKINTSGLGENKVSIISSAQNLLRFGKAPVIILNVDGTPLEQLKSGSFEVRPGVHKVTVGLFFLYTAPAMVRNILFTTEAGKKYVIDYKNIDDTTVKYYVYEESSGVVVAEDEYKPLNELPMYGAPHFKKTPQQEALDKNFILSVSRSEGSREEAAKRFAETGWMEVKKGDLKTAMKRFNQAWLLNPKYYQPYWGFGTLMLEAKKPEKAAGFLEKALLLIEEGDAEKSRLLTETARAYVHQAAVVKGRKPEKAIRLYDKANKMIDNALDLDSANGNAYRIGAIIAKEQGNYPRARHIVKKAHETGAYKFDDNFIDTLSEELSEP